VAKRKAEDGDGQPKLSKRARRTLARRAKALTDHAGAKGGAKPNVNVRGTYPALQNGGIGDGGAFQKKDKGKGKGKGKGGKGPCYAFNDGTKCKFDPCPFSHECQTCGGQHPRGHADCPGVRGG
jgi:hypothetical protein